MPIIRSNDKDSFSPFFDFLARYVRKLHSDRYIKNWMKTNQGKSFLDMIGASDVAYVITILKNNWAMWSHDPTDENATAPTAPLFTRGENKKRTYGKTTMSKQGLEYYRKGVKNWSKILKNKEDPIFNSIKSNWETWLQDDSAQVDSTGWRRKNLRSLLGMRDGEDGWGGNQDEDDIAAGTEEEEEERFCYDSDGDVGYISTMGGGRNAARGGHHGTENEEGSEDEVDEDASRKRPHDDVEGDDDSGEEDNRKPAAVEKNSEVIKGKGRKRGVTPAGNGSDKVHNTRRNRNTDAAGPADEDGNYKI